MGTEQKDLSRIFAQSINMSRPKKDGAGTFYWTTGKNLQTDVKYILTTGIEPFDEYVGGFPLSHISEVFGLENCGKTALMIRTVCRFQAHHIYEVISKQGFTPVVKRVDPTKVRLIKAYVDNEGSLENSFKLSIHDIRYDEKGEEVVDTTSLDLDKIAVGLCDTIEQVFLAFDKFLDLIKDTEEDEKEKEEKAKKKGEEYEPKIVLGIFVVDTIAGTSSKDEMERDWGERDFPRAAGKISEGFRRLRAEIMRRNVAAIFTNQVRTQFQPAQGGGHKVRYSTPQEKDFSTYGGKALHFYAHHRIFMFQMPLKYTLVKGAKFPAGYMVGFRTIKNRIRKGGREGRMVLLFDEEMGGLNNILSILETLIFLDAAEYHDSGEITFRFKDFGIEMTTFAEPTSGRSRKAVEPEIAGRYEWFAYYRAHRADFDKLWKAALDRSNATEGLHAFKEPEDTNPPGEDGEDFEKPRRRSRRAPTEITDPDTE